MTAIKFNIDYKTEWGEELCIAGNFLKTDKKNKASYLVLSTQNGVSWFGEINLPSTSSKPVEYYYFVYKDGHEIRKEEGPDRLLFIKNKSEIVVNDHWKDQLSLSYLYTSVFTESVFKHKLCDFTPYRYNKSILLNVICPYVKKNEKLVILGEGDLLGNWVSQNAFTLSPVHLGEWQLELNAADFTEDTLYKFAIVNKSDLSIVHWEDGENRILRISGISSNEKELYVESGMLFKYSSFQWKGKGVAIPLFSLRTNKSSGIGEYLDLKKMIDWAAETDQNMVQILPINDTNSSGTWKDSYPYSSISIFALNPIYLSINEFTLQNKTKLKSYLSKAKKLNKLEALDYEQVFILKNAFLRDLFSEEGAEVMQSEEYIRFYEKNRTWLFPYLCFSYLRDRYKTAYFKDWDIYSTYQPEVLEKLIKTDPQVQNETNFYAYLQFLADRQLKSP